MPPPPPPPASLRPTPPPPPGAKTNGVNGNKPKPPAPPAKRPVRSSANSAANVTGTPRDSGLSLGAQTDSGRSTPSLAGGLAEALRARQSAMKGKKEEDDDDDW